MDVSHQNIVSATDVEAKPAKPARNRDSLFLTARVRITGEAREHEVRIRNLSEGGLMAELGRAVPVGIAATLQVRGIGEVTGRVAWCAEGRVGIAFDAPIDPKRARKPVGTGRKTPIYAKPLI
jgi:hypothetical protein